MAIARMQSVEVLIHRSRITEVLELLQQRSIIELLEQNIWTPSDSLQLTQALEFCERIFPRNKSFMENFITIKHLVRPQAYQRMAADKVQVKRALSELAKLRENWETLNRQEQALVQKELQYAVYTKFPLATKYMASLKQVSLITGLIPIKEYRSKQVLLSSLPLLAELQVYATDVRYAYVGISYHHEVATQVTELLTQIAFTPVHLPLTKSLTKDYQELTLELKTVRQELVVLRKKIGVVYQQSGITLSVWADMLTNREKLQALMNAVPRSETVYAVQGWIAASRYPELEELLKPYAKHTQLSSLVTIEKPPVLLKNNMLIKPFEAVTDIYGMPNSNEYDPTPLLALFFIIYYGLCFSDAGYGLMLVGFSLMWLKQYRKHLTPYGINLLTLNSWCGISTIIVGVLSGSYFGLNIGALPFPVVRDFILHLKIVDPIANPLPMLIFSFILGIIQIYFGLWVKYFLDIKQQGWYVATLLSGTWIYFISGLIAMVFFPWAKWIVYSGLVFLIITQGRHQRHPLMRLGSGLISLYRLSGLVGDVLSYSRLFALGLVTGVLAMVINLLAELTGHIPIVGVFIMVAVFIAGHLFDFFINILGSFVHSARLQYVEYFSKFFEGGGRFFRPFSWQTKYITIDNAPISPSGSFPFFKGKPAQTQTSPSPSSRGREGWGDFKNKGVVLWN